MTPLLEGLKIIEMTRLGPGPFCGMVLGDLGADVLRVDEPQAAGRTLAPEAAAFVALNRNKRSIILDLKRAGAQQVLRRLAAQADVFVEGFRPGVMSRLGCDYETLCALNPRLVYCSISGYGQDGPYSRIPGHDLNYIAVTGALSMFAHADGRPVVPPNVVADFGAGGMYAAVTILAAIAARERSGAGQYLDIALSDSVLYLMTNIATRYFRDGDIPQPGKWDLNGRSPAYNVYLCKDGGYMSVCCGEPRFWEALCRTLGRDDLAGSMRERTDDEATYEGIAAAFMQRTRDEWWAIMRSDPNLAVAPVYQLDEALRDDHHIHRGMVAEAGIIQGRSVRHIGPAPGVETPGMRSLPPVPGQHTDEVLRDLGYTQDAIEGLRQTHAVG